MAGAHWVTAMKDKRPISTSRSCPCSMRAHAKPSATTPSMATRVHRSVIQ